MTIPIQITGQDASIRNRSRVQGFWFRSQKSEVGFPTDSWAVKKLLYSADLMEQKDVRLLIVEDNEDHAELIRLACEASADNISITIVRNLKEARAAIPEHHPSLIIADMMLPDGKGFDLIDADPRNQNYPVVVMTSHGDEQSAVEAMKAGALDYVVKSPEIFSDIPHIAQRALREWENITERKKAEDERTRLSSAIEQSAEMIVIMDPDGKIEYINPATEKTMGYSREESIGDNPFFTERGIYDKQFYRKILATLKNGKTWEGHITFKKKDGMLAEFEQTMSPIKDSSGKIINFISIARDITKEIRLEQQLQQSRKMEALGTLAGGIAHDFNNILAAIISYTEMNILHEFKDLSKANNNSEQILKAANRAKDLIKQILTFSRQSDQEKTPLQLSKTIDDVIKLLRATLPSTIEIHYMTDIDPVVQADRTQMQQLLMNLCTNAAHALREKEGILEISLHEIDLDPESATDYRDLNPGPYVQVTVSDTGTGIDPLIIDRIFDPFFTTKDAGEGTGMGLALVHGIVKSHNGDIIVDSTRGKGTRFQILLPRVQFEIKHTKDLLLPLPTGNESILFVDDDVELVTIVSEMIKSLGYSVVTTSNSIEALNIFTADPQKFDLVITDQTMPRLTGFDLAQKFLDIRPDIPIILCTGYSETVTLEKARETGIKEFILKPIDRKKMAETIRHILDAT